MSEDKTTLDENEQSTLDENAETEQVEDLDNLFDEEEKQEDEPVTREEYNKLLKGTQKLATQYGNLKTQKKEDVKTKPESKVVAPSDDISELFYAQIPKAELVSDDLKTIAESKYGGSILKAWKGESWIQEKASALESTKNEDEANKSKISKPSNGTSPKRVDILKVKPEEVESLKPSDKAVWVKAQVEKERRDE
jgi:hypothetical protein